MWSKIFTFSNRNKHHINNGHYFAIEDGDIDQIIKVLNIKVIQKAKCSEAFRYLYNGENNSKKTEKTFKVIISHQVNGWVFIYSENSIFENNKKWIEQLISINKKRVNYYYFDSHIDSYEWIIADKGKLNRIFEYQMLEVFHNIGEYLTSEEKKFVEFLNTDDFIFGEDVANSIIKASCNIKKKYFDKNHQFIIGKANPIN